MIETMIAIVYVLNLAFLAVFLLGATIGMLYVICDLWS